MNEQQLAAVEQALEALEKSLPRLAPYGEQDWLDSCKAITALQSIISQDALYKMAEDASTIGLSYNDWPKIGCVNHDCDKCKAAQQAPLTEAKKVELATNWFAEDWAITKAVGMLYDYDRLMSDTPPAPQPVPVKTYHDGKPWPVAPKPWVGLDEDEVEDCARGCANHAELAQAIEAKLKEKNA